MNLTDILFDFLLMLVAFLYAMVGHGGASGYLALMALFGQDPGAIRPTVLVLNILVSFLAFVQFQRAGNMHWKLFLWLVLGSIPAAYIGGTVSLDDSIYRKVLGLVLLVPVARFAGWNIPEKQARILPAFLLTAIGAGIGLISGLIGIGGGILLTPVLLILGAAGFKEVAAVSALFITVNSIAGLLGLRLSGVDWSGEMGLWIALAVAGAWLGSWAGARKLSPLILKKVLAFVLAIAAFKLIFT